MPGGRAGGPAAPRRRLNPGPARPLPRGGLAPVRRHAAAGGGEGRAGGEPEPGRRSLPPAASHTRNFHFPGGGRGTGARATPRKERGGSGRLRKEPAPLLPREGTRPRDSPAEEGQGESLPRARDPPSPPTPLGRARAGRQPRPPTPTPHPPRQGAPRCCRGIPSPPLPPRCQPFGGLNRSLPAATGERGGACKTDTGMGVVSYS